VYLVKRLAPLLLIAGCSAPVAPAVSQPVRVTEAPQPVFEAIDVSDLPAPLTLDDPTGALAPFYQSLASGGRVVITEYGDSHTAGDRLTGQVRHVLQQRFGDGGRGFLLTGRPAIKWYEQIDAHYGTDGDWKADQGGKKNTSEPYGLAGVRSYAERSSAQAWIQTCDDCAAGTAVGSFELYFLRQKDGGVLEARVDDGEWQRIHTALGKDQGEVALPDYALIEVADGPHKLTLRPRGSKKVDVFGVALERKQPGVVVDALGIVGLQMSHLWSWDWSVISPQLAHRGPSLVILQYGTNEADQDNLDVSRFEERYVELIERVRAAVPGAAVLMLGPPDMQQRELGKKECAKAAKALEKKLRKARKKGKELDETMPEGCNWTTPPKLLEVIDAERRAAARTGVAFFDTFSAMGGAGTIATMIEADPPLAYQDHVHFNGKGYAAWADLLLEDLMRGYATWEKRTISTR
jgi:lysophospholipase L1-like esterase